jgi:hypothetical protein
LGVEPEADSYFWLIDSCITQLKAQGPSRTCSESKEEEEEFGGILLGFLNVGELLKQLLLRHFPG